MYYKKFEHYLILSLIKQITMTLYVSAKPIDFGQKNILFSDYQLENLANEVCNDLELIINVTAKTCRNNYRAPDWSKPINSTSVSVRCLTRHSIRFDIDPSQHYQLVALVPQLNNDSSSGITYINYSIIEPYQHQGQISTTPQRNYTIWSAVLKDGSPIEWLRGDKAPSYNSSMEHRRYDIKPAFPPKTQDSTITGRFSWNSIGDYDACFDVANSCVKTKFQSTKVGPISRDSDPGVEFEVQPNDECSIRVTGLYGSTDFQYHTPSWNKSQYSQNAEEIQPEIPDNITIVAIKDIGGTWDVYVFWQKPQLFPDYYNVTVHAENTRTVIVPGNETETVVKGVEGDEGLIYEVLMYSKIGRWEGHTSRRAALPSTKEARGAGGGGASGAALGAACAAAAALALLCRCRWGRQRVAVPPYKPDDKPSKDGDTEVLEVWSESEDRWEVRADKLVLHEVIGEGAFGVVRRATLAPHSTPVAVKMLKDFPSLDEIRSFRSEMELMKSVGVHPHLVSLVGCCSGRRPLIIVEYCSRGDLLSYLRCTWDVMLSKRNAKYYNNNIDVSDYRNDLFKCKAQMESSKLVVNKLYELQEICDKELTALDLLSFCRQIAMGMEFLAANRVVHRDLAARNILVTADRTLKIADFGLSRDVYEENQYKQKGNGKMPVKWMALESLTRRIYTTQSDVWSFGVVAWEVASLGGAPYAGVPGARLPRLLRGGYRLPRPAHCSPLLYDIMLSCWRAHPRDRPTFAELHQRLDELLNSACANQYLSLEIDADDAPPTPKHHRYIKMLMRGKRGWTRGESYERPLKAPHANHYTTPPDSLSAHPA
ncbi:tyrosine-protein kinase receptor torso [Helicoverpa armigera]|uniref:tyrosine-protein kinase receptor torso n=1 Tax=Helicoverpa armigera TaxID=29058 RepID=UPI0030838EC8